MSGDQLRMGDLTARFHVTRWTVHRWIRELGFPPGAACVGSKGKVWEAADVEAWKTANILPGLLDDDPAGQPQ